MKRGGLIVLLVLMVVLGGGFLTLIWLDMRHSINTPVNLPPRRSDNGSEERREPREGRERREPRERQEQAGGQKPCDVSGISCASQYFAAWTMPAAGACHATMRNGYPEPDTRCTPGGVTPGITAETLRDPQWRTKCIRNCQSSEQQKHIAYEWYGVPKPDNNQGANQVCELDHLVPLELGGADGLGNIWPECGPDGATLRERYFKQKDVVENYLAAQVRSGAMPLGEAQKGIAVDWVQYLEEARRVCRGGRC